MALTDQISKIRGRGGELEEDLFLPPRRFIEVVDAVSDGSTGTFIANNLGGVKRLGLLEFLGGFQGELERYRYGYNQVLNNFLTGFYDKFHAIFGIYRVSGGYPRIFFQAAESTLKGSLNIEDRLYSEDIYQIFLDDARVLGLNYEELLNIIRRINNPVMEISKDFATLNPNSMKLTLLKKYLSYMQLSGLFGFLKRVSSKEDINYEDKVVTGSDGHPKLVVNDPSVFVAFYMRSRGAGPIFKKASDIIFENKKGFLLESIVISHAAYLPQRGRVPYDHVCYVLENNVSDSIPEKETTDILIWYLNHKNELIVIPVEVKSGVYHIEKIKINAKRLKEMGCGRLIVVVDSKIIDIQEDYVIVPIELFLALF